MKLHYLYIVLDRKKRFASYYEDSHDGDYAEEFGYELFGTTSLAGNERRILIEVSTNRSNIDRLVANLTIRDTNFLADASRESILGVGTICDVATYLQQRHHIFTIAVSESMNLEIARQADLAILENKGTMACTLGVPKSLIDSSGNFARNTVMPVLEYAFEFDSRKRADDL